MSIYCFACKKLAKCSKCGKCGRIFYCGVECQRADWPRHKQECAGDGATATPTRPAADAMHARIRMLTECAAFNSLCGSVAAQKMGGGGGATHGYIGVAALGGDQYTINYIDKLPARVRDGHYTIVIAAAGLSATLFFPAAECKCIQPAQLPIKVKISGGVLEFAAPPST